MEITLTAIYEKEKDWFIGYVEELKGVNTQGRTLEEVKENLREAIQLILKSNKELVQKEISGKNVIREKIVVAI